VGRAGPCLFDEDTGRPIAGTYELNNDRYLENGGMSWEDKLSLSMHEIAHVIWFSNFLFTRYHEEQVT